MPRADDEQVAGEQRDEAEQAEFLADHREDEVGRALGQEFELRLAAVHPALAEHAARADRDLRLDDVVAGAERVALRVEQRQHALALVVVHEVPDDRHRRAQHRDAARAGGASDRPAHDQHDDAGRRDQQRRAEVGLLGNQADRHAR